MLITKDEKKFIEIADIEPESCKFFKDLDKRIKEKIIHQLNRTEEMFDITGGTENIKNWRLKQFILRHGFVAFAAKSGKLYSLLGDFGGDKDPQYIPTEFIFANPWIPWSDKLKIDKDCVIVRSDYNCQGILPLIKKYSVYEAHAELSAYMAMVNSRLMTLGIAGRDQEAKAFEVVMEAIERGDIKAIADKNIINGLKTQPYGGQTGILTDLIENLQYNKGSYNNSIGLDSNFNMKRESISTAEIGMNTDALRPYMEAMFDCITEGLDKVNEMFGDLLENGPYKLEYASAWKTSEKEIEAAEEILDEPKEDPSDETKEEEEPKNEDDTSLPTVDD